MLAQTLDISRAAPASPLAATIARSIRRFCLAWLGPLTNVGGDEHVGSDRIGEEIDLWSQIDADLAHIDLPARCREELGRTGKSYLPARAALGTEALERVEAAVRMAA